jgi:hypothetical protein
MNISIFLSKCLGIYLTFISIVFVTQKDRFKKLIVDMMNKPEVMVVTGFMAFIIGTLLVVSHNIWVFDWRVLITIAGWMAIGKGISIILFPKYLTALTMLWIKSDAMYYGVFVLTFIMGIFLLYHGWASLV